MTRKSTYAPLSSDPSPLFKTAENFLRLGNAYRERLAQTTSPPASTTPANGADQANGRNGSERNSLRPDAPRLAVLDFVNAICRYKYALLHDTDETGCAPWVPGMGRRFSDDPAVFCTLAISRVHDLSKPALRTLKEVGEVATFRQPIEDAYFQFCAFCEEAKSTSVSAPGRVQRLLSSGPWQQLRSALDRIAFNLPLLQAESSDGESIADQFDRGDLLLFKATIPTPLVEAEAPPASTSKERPCAGRDSLFFEWYNEEGTRTYHSNSQIAKKWKAMSKEAREAHSPERPEPVSTLAVKQAIKRMKKASENGRI